MLRGRVRRCVLASCLLSCAPACEPRPAPSDEIAFMRRGRVMIVDANGSAERALTETLRHETERPVTWTPDGSRVLYWNHSDIGWDIWSVPVDGGDAVNLTRVASGGCRSPAPSPDGSLIAFVRDDPEGVHLMNADGSNQRRVTERAHRDQAPSWSADGSRLVFLVLHDDRREIERLDLSRGATTTLVRGSSPSFSPDGRRVLFVARRDGAACLCTISSDGSGEHRLTSDPGGAHNPAWSPDGRRIAYFTELQGTTALRVLSLDGGENTAIASFEGRALAPPSWAPDGRRLAVGIETERGAEILVVDDQGRSRREIAANGARYPAWRPAATRAAPNRATAAPAPSPAPSPSAAPSAPDPNAAPSARP